jgi:hypothetical protein
MFNLRPELKKRAKNAGFTRPFPEFPGAPARPEPLSRATG